MMPLLIILRPIIFKEAYLNITTTTTIKGCIYFRRWTSHLEQRTYSMGKCYRKEGTEKISQSVLFSDEINENYVPFKIIVCQITHLFSPHK